MTIEQKEQVLILRKEGLSYGKIADEIGISVNTIKSYCKRNNIKDKKDTIEIFAIKDVCKHCGTHLDHQNCGQPKKFCSEECRRIWWKRNADQISRKAFYSLTCGECGNEFKSYGNKKRKFCSHDCYINNRFKIARDRIDSGPV